MRKAEASRNFVAGLIGAVLAVGALAAGLHAAAFEPVTLPGSGDLTDVLRDLATACLLYTSPSPRD